MYLLGDLGNLQTEDRLPLQSAFSPPSGTHRLSVNVIPSTANPITCQLCQLDQKGGGVYRAMQYKIFVHVNQHFSEQN